MKKIENLLCRYLAAKNAKTAAEEEFSIAESALKEALAETETIDVYARKTWFTLVYKERKGAMRIDGKSLQKDLPEVYEKYSKRNASSRPLIVKIK